MCVCVILPSLVRCVSGRRIHGCSGSVRCSSLTPAPVQAQSLDLAPPSGVGVWSVVLAMYHLHPDNGTSAGTGGECYSLCGDFQLTNIQLTPS